MCDFVLCGKEGGEPAEKANGGGGGQPSRSH